MHGALRYRMPFFSPLPASAGVLCGYSWRGEGGFSLRGDILRCFFLLLITLDYFAQYRVVCLLFRLFLMRGEGPLHNVSCERHVKVKTTADLSFPLFFFFFLLAGWHDL